LNETKSMHFHNSYSLKKHDYDNWLPFMNTCLLQTAFEKPTGMGWPQYQRLAIHNRMKVPLYNLCLVEALQPTAAGPGTHTCLETCRGIVCQLLSGKDVGQHVYLSATLHIHNPAKHAEHRFLTSLTVRSLIKHRPRVILVAISKHFRLIIQCTIMEVCVSNMIVKLIFSDWSHKMFFR